MEVKLSHRRPSMAFPNQTTTFSSHSFYFKRHFSGLQRNGDFKFMKSQTVETLQRTCWVMWSKIFGGRGKNLTSISKQYGVSVNSILEENRSIVDVDLVFQGQQLKIPSSSAEEIRAIEKNKLSIFDLRDTHQRSLKIFNGLLGKKYFTMQITRTLPHLLHQMHDRLVSHELLEIGNAKLLTNLKDILMSKSTRWKYALSDITDADIPDPESTSDSNDSSEDHAQTSFENMSHV